MYMVNGSAKRMSFHFQCSFALNVYLASLRVAPHSLQNLLSLGIFLAAYRGLTLYATSLEDKIDAVELAIRGKLDVDDGLQFVSARRLSVEGIVSLDKHFEKREIPRIDPSASPNSL